MVGLEMKYLFKLKFNMVDIVCMVVASHLISKLSPLSLEDLLEVSFLTLVGIIISVFGQKITGEKE